MSQQVVINYEAMAIECRSICEIAVKQLCKIETLLQKIDESAKTLQGEETAEMKRQLKNRANAIKSQIDMIIEESEAVAERGVVRTDSEYLQGDERRIIEIAKNLSREVDSLTTKDIANYNALLNNLFNKELEKHRRRTSGTVEYDAKFSAELAKVENEALRGFIYIEWLDNRNIGKNFAELRKIAEMKMEIGVENYFKAERKKIVAEIETEMRSAKLDEKIIASVLETDAIGDKAQIADIRSKATEELIGESVRKKTLKIVKECIEKRGFIIDSKNIKLQREKNEVIMVAQKISGEMAEFRVMLDGKFIYNFNGYEGQACQNDIQPFMKDLEDIYGVKVIKKEEIWNNPDKISTQKYQQMKTQTNRG